MVDLMKIAALANAILAEVNGFQTTPAGSLPPPPLPTEGWWAYCQRVAPIVGIMPAAAVGLGYKAEVAPGFNGADTGTWPAAVLWAAQQMLGPQVQPGPTHL